MLCRYSLRNTSKNYPRRLTTSRVIHGETIQSGFDNDSIISPLLCNKKDFVMSRFSGGWVKISRSLCDGSYDAVDIGILFWLICNANYVDGKSLARSGHKRVIVPRGTLVTSVGEMELALNVARGVLRNRLKNFVEEGILAIKTTNTGSVITICNYDKYQSMEGMEEPAVEPSDNHRTTIGQPSDNHILKKVRKKETKKVTITKPPKPKLGTDEVIARYCELFEQEHKTKAIISGMDAGSLGHITKAHGKDLAIQIVEEYFRMADQWVMTQCHPVALIKKQINKILVNIANKTKEPEHRWLEIPKRGAE